jgi:hypothetical protein
MPIPFKIIKKLTCFVLVLAVFGCTQVTKQPDKKVAKKVVKEEVKKHKEIKYSEKELIAFFDSVGSLPVQPLADKAAFWADSVFENFTEPMKRAVSPTDFKKLKKAIQAKFINVRTAQQIFGKLNLDTACNANGLLDSVPKGTLRLHYYNFKHGKNKFYEYGIRIGDPEHCPGGSQLFYLKNDTIIARQDGDSRFFDDDVKYFTNVDGEAIVYRLIEFDHGSGIWWLNYFFYKYDGDKLIQVLNELQNGNMQGMWGFRELWLESKIEKTNPLTIKMVFNNYLLDENKIDDGRMIINDSTIVRYKWDKKAKKLEGQYQQSKISKTQILSYYLVDNDLLFIKAFSKPLKAALNNKENRTLMLRYLERLKNYRDTVGR